MQIGIERFFLENPGRPLPKTPTHMVVADILNNDLSIKRITVYFNPEDHWIDPSWKFGQNNPKAVGSLIGSSLSFISKDEAAQAYKYWIVEIKTNEVVEKSGCIYHAGKVHYATDMD